MSLNGTEIKTYGAKLFKSEVTATLQAVVKTFIPPNRIRRKNIEGSELLDFVATNENLDETFANIGTEAIHNEDEVETDCDSDDKERVSDDQPEEVEAERESCQ